MKANIPEPETWETFWGFDRLPRGGMYGGKEFLAKGVPPLDERQRAFLADPQSALLRRWMYDTSGRFAKTGRTYALAHYYIHRAWNADVGEKVLLIDHDRVSEYADGNLYGTVLHILREINLATCHGSGGPYIWVTPEMKENPPTWQDWQRGNLLEAGKRDL